MAERQSTGEIADNRSIPTNIIIVGNDEAITGKIA